MKNISITFILLLVLAVTVQAQDFNKHIAEARNSYASGDLSHSRFAMEQLLRELDVAIGKDILKLLPTKLETLEANQKEDQVTGSGAGIGSGLFVHRSYGTASKRATLDIINDSPLINSLNAILAIPFVVKAGDSNQKVVKIQGYKSLLTKITEEGNNKIAYELQIPLDNTLVSLRVDDTKEADVVKMASAIPLAKIAQMAK